MDWAGHWHGFGPWTGTRAEYGNESLRRPGNHPTDEQTRAFLASHLPPVQTGHALLRRDQTSADRTWTDVADALAWLQKTYDEHPPADREDGRAAYLDLNARTGYARDALTGGSDVVWAYYSSRSSFVAFSVICCPHRLLSTIACPRPPA